MVGVRVRKIDIRVGVRVGVRKMSFFDQDEAVGVRVRIDPARRAPGC